VFLSKGLSLPQGINIPVFVKLRGLNGGEGVVNVVMMWRWSGLLDGGF